MFNFFKRVFLSFMLIILITACSKSKAQKEADKQREINANKTEFAVRKKDGTEFVFKTPKGFFHSLKFDDDGYLVRAYVNFRSTEIQGYPHTENFKVKVFMHKHTDGRKNLGYFYSDDLFSKERGLLEQIYLDKQVEKNYPQNSNWKYTLETYRWIGGNLDNDCRLLLPNNEYVQYRHPYTQTYYFETTVNGAISIRYAISSIKKMQDPILNFFYAKKKIEDLIREER